MTRSGRTLALSAALALLAAAGGCGRNDDQAEAELVFNNGPEVNSLDPHVISWRHDIRIANALFEGLTTFRVEPPTEGDPLGAVVVEPAAAESWEISDDGRVYTFRLRDDARWSNGEPVTARHFRWSWRRVMSPATGSDYANLMWVIDGAKEYYDALAAGEPASFDDVGVEAPDDKTLVVRLRGPTAYFLDLTAFAPFMPVYPPLLAEHPMPGRDADHDGVGVYAESWTRPEAIVTNGPYVLAEHDFHDSMLLRRNEHYWNRQNVPLETIRALAIEDVKAGFNAYEEGRSMLQDGLPANAARAILDLPPGDRPAGFRAVPALGTYYIRLNCTPTAAGAANPLQEPAVRRALAMAIDRERITGQITGSDEPVAMSFIPPTLRVPDGAGGVMAYRPPPGAFGFDPDAAAAELARAGYPGGEGLGEIRLMYNSGNRHQPIMEAVGAMWRRHLGVQVVLDPLDASAFGEALKAPTDKRWHAGRGGWFADYRDPSSFLEMFHSDDGNNDSGYRDDEVDRLLRAAVVQRDQHRRMEMYRRVEDIVINRDAVVIPLYHYVDMWMVSPAVEGAYPNIMGMVLLKQLSLDR